MVRKAAEIEISKNPPSDDFLVWLRVEGTVLVTKLTEARLSSLMRKLGLGLSRFFL